MIGRYSLNKSINSKPITHAFSDNNRLLISKIILIRFFAIVAKNLHSGYVKKSEPILERLESENFGSKESELDTLPPTPQPWLKSCFVFLANPFNADVVGVGYPVRQLFVTHLSAVEMKLTEIQNDLALNFQSMSVYSDFLRHVPESKYPELKRPVCDSLL